MPASCCPRRIALRWRLRYEEPSSLDRGRVIGPDLSSVLMLVGVGRRVVGVVDGWWCGQTSSIGGGVAVMGKKVGTHYPGLPLPGSPLIFLLPNSFVERV